MSGVARSSRFMPNTYSPLVGVTAGSQTAPSILFAESIYGGLVLCEVVICCIGDSGLLCVVSCGSEAHGWFPEEVDGAWPEPVDGVCVHIGGNIGVALGNDACNIFT